MDKLFILLFILVANIVSILLIYHSLDKNIEKTKRLLYAMNMGRSNFYRKLKGILNMSPNEYLRLFRLKQAASILKEGTYGVVEVSYMVGFSTPSYFSSCFKKQFGVLPKDFISH